MCLLESRSAIALVASATILICIVCIVEVVAMLPTTLVNSKPTVTCQGYGRAWGSVTLSAQRTPSLFTVLAGSGRPRRRRRLVFVLKIMEFVLAIVL